MMAQFDSADADTSGELTYEEWEAAFGGNTEKRVLRELFDELDIDKDGRLSVNEFLEGLSGKTLQSPRRQAFPPAHPSSPPTLSGSRSAGVASKALVDPGTATEVETQGEARRKATGATVSREETDTTLLLLEIKGQMAEMQSHITRVLEQQHQHSQELLMLRTQGLPSCKLGEDGGTAPSQGLTCEGGSASHHCHAPNSANGSLQGLRKDQAMADQVNVEVTPTGARQARPDVMGTMEMGDASRNGFPSEGRY
jgi:hypothetical protein